MPSLVERWIQDLMEVKPVDYPEVIQLVSQVQSKHHKELLGEFEQWLEASGRCCPLCLMNPKPCQAEYKGKKS